MQLKLSRLRRGEILAAPAAVALVAFLLLLPWFATAGSGSLDGWHSLPVLRWLLLVVAALGLALSYCQASRRAPSLPLVLAMILTVISFVATVALIIRLPTSAASPRLGAYLGLAATAAMTVAAFWSQRDETGWVPDDEHPVERIPIDG